MADYRSYNGVLWNVDWEKFHKIPLQRFIQIIVTRDLYAVVLNLDILVSIYIQHLYSRVIYLWLFFSTSGHK